MDRSSKPTTRKRKRAPEVHSSSSSKVSVQIVVGFYERVLQGVVASVTDTQEGGAGKESAGFSNNFLINAHASSVRCLAISPPSNVKTATHSSTRILATGGADERVNLYQIGSSTPHSPHEHAAAPNLELGSLLHHSSTVTALSFPSRSKLLSASLDNKIAISRVRDWTVLSEIKAPVPKAHGRPSGDTAAPGEVPAGITDVAVHPSAKMCLSVGQGERCMRLWNLVAGKKAGVLTFDKAMVKALAQSKWRGGEARRVIWSPGGEDFAVGFEQGAAVYDMSCMARGIVTVQGTKVCQMRYLTHSGADQGDATETVNGDDHTTASHVLAISTEDGRILLYDTSTGTGAHVLPSATNGAEARPTKYTEAVPQFRCIGQIGEKTRGRRIKDFVVLPTQSAEKRLLIVNGLSDGVVQVWSLDKSDLIRHSAREPIAKSSEESIPQLGMLLGSCQTGRRITCLEAFVLSPADAPERHKNGDAAGAADEDWTGFESD